MTSLPLVDPELRPLLDAWPTVTLSTETLADLRARDLPLPAAPDSGVDVTEIMVPGPEGAPDVALRIYRPRDAQAPLGGIYHIHGGGYVGGSAKELEFIHRPLAGALGCVIVSVDYRLAPETMFPGAIEDCYAGLRWTVDHAGELGIDATRLGVMGESAGGGLAAALALMARDRGEVSLAFQHLTYPMIDDRTCTAAPHAFAGEFIWTPPNNRFGWAALIGAEPGGEDVSPYCAAARATDLSGLPPTFIMTGTLDLFVDEDIDYARRLIAAGVATELHVHPGAFHGFDALPGPAVANRAQAARLDALARALS